VSVQNLYTSRLCNGKLQCRPSPAHAVSDLWDFKQATNETTTLLKAQEFFFLRKQKRNDLNVAEEYCWALTQAAGRSCCSRSGVRVLGFGLQLDAYVYSVPICAVPSGTLLLRKSESVCNVPIIFGVSARLLASLYFSIYRVRLVSTDIAQYYLQTLPKSIYRIA